MNRLKTINDAALHDEIRRLKRDIEDFSGRAEREAAALEREGRPIMSAPLYQRLTSIRNHLEEQLEDAETERARRRNPARKRPGSSLRTAFAALTGAQS